MALKLSDKKTIVGEMNQVATNSISVIAAEYRGLTVEEMTELRSNARKSKVFMKVCKNTLAARALEETEFACLSDSLSGPIVLFFSQEEPSAAARLLRDFVKTHENLKVKALALNGQLLGPHQLEAVASLPSREEAIAQLMSVMNAPVTKFVRTLQETYAQAVRVFAAVSEKKK